MPAEIPPPTLDDLARDLAADYASMAHAAFSLERSYIRRAVAAEAENAALAARVKELEVRLFRVHAEAKRERQELEDRIAGEFA
jgi:hypothetical protein